MKDDDRTTRRNFLKTGAAVAGLAFAANVSGCAAPKRKPVGPLGAAPKREKLRLAFIGTGGIGHYHLDSTKDLDIVCPCYCDVDTHQWKRAAELHPQAKAYQDYREMLEKERNNYDAVMIGTPDHSHFPATMIAMQFGKHVYTQKPLTHTPWEARELVKAAEKYKVATQMGNQGHAKEGWRLVYEWIHAGAIGRVLETHVWTDRPIWPQGMGRPEGEDPVPDYLNWDCWLGPAPLRPYKGPADGKGNGPYHKFNWRGWWDFGNGALGDMACHTMDGVWAALDPGYPTSVEPLAATEITSEAFPNASVVKWEFPAKPGRPAFTNYWYDGGLKPPFPIDLEATRKYASGGCLFVGTKAKILVAGDYCDSPRIIPEAKMKEIGKPKQLLERSPGHIEEWIMAAKGEKPLDFARSNFFYSGPFTETVLLGNIALRVGRRLEWDAKKLEFTNYPEANRYVTKEYRDGWKVI